MKPTFSIFSENIKRYSTKLILLQNQFAKVAMARIFAMLLAGTILIVSIKYNWPYIGSIIFIVMLVWFLWLVIRHSKLKRQITFYTNLQAINSNELDCIAGNYSLNFDGAVYQEAHHPYTSDLDVFGKNSIYQQLCRASTDKGRDLLAEYLKYKTGNKAISDRQMAISELANMIDWRQQLNAYAIETHLKSATHQIAKENEGTTKLESWINEPSVISKSPILPHLLPAVQTLSVVCLVAVAFGFTSKILWLPVIINVTLIYKYRKYLESVKNALSAQTRFLRSYAQMIQHLEEVKFTSPGLLAIQARVYSVGETASSQINRLAKLVERLDATQNLYFLILANGLFVWDLYWSQKLELWKETTRNHIWNWFQAIYQAEAISSMAAFHYLHPDWVFPQITDAPFLLEGKGLGHPLLRSEKRVDNDIAMGGSGKLLIITGSNMSGKSTFLRTLGINSVMALAGMAVCAKDFKISPFQIFTSMRTQDSLEESTSSFYAELKRLQQLLLILNPDQPVFYLLDEILKGTNSLDRHNGAKALSLQLLESNASGIISTHDIELGALEQAQFEKIKNYSFNSYFTDGKLHFDYKLTPGVCKSFNASELMKQIGIKITESPD